MRKYISGIYIVLIMALASIQFTRGFSHKIIQVRPFLRRWNNAKLFSTTIANDDNGIAGVTQSPPSLKVTDLSLLELRIGRIVEVKKHPEADNLYVERIDLGESSGPRTIVSGLVEYCTPEQLVNRLVVVLCNLKPRTIKGITSNGMIMCASNDSHTKVDPIIPPAEAKVGELITFPGHSSSFVEPGNKATKAFTKISAGFHGDEHGQAKYLDSPFMTSAGPITASIKGRIS